MGMDAYITIKAKPGFRMDDHVELGIDIEEAEDNWLGNDQATHEIDPHQRYYGEGYQRGYWPHISAILKHLLDCRTVEAVWYGHDNDRMDRIDHARVEVLDNLYKGNHFEEYTVHTL